MTERDDHGDRSGGNEPRHRSDNRRGGGGERGGPADGGEGRRQSGAGGTSVWEWVVAGMSTALVLALIAYLVYLGVSAPHTPPHVTIRRDTVTAMEGGYVVTFTARNTGGATAASVQVDGELKADTATIEKRSATLRFVPAGATRHGGLFFTHDPRSYRLELSASGYDRP